MNLPNKLTLSRIILVPFFVASLLINFPFHTAVALVILLWQLLQICLTVKSQEAEDL